MHKDKPNIIVAVRRGKTPATTTSFAGKQDADVPFLGYTLEMALYQLLHELPGLTRIDQDFKIKGFTGVYRMQLYLRS